MASSSASADYFSASSTTNATTPRPAIRPRPGASAATPTNAASPLTPLLNRSISSQYNSPGGSSFRNDQEEQVIYELGARHFSAGFAGESRPRCIHYFSREDGRRVGDFRACDPGYRPHRRKRRKMDAEDDDGSWTEAEDVELYRNDVRALDLALVEDKLERVVRNVHTDYLQLDQKSRKALLVIPSLLPTPVVEIALKVLFQHYAQPPAIALLTTPLLACVGAGMRDGLVVDVGWQETVVTAVGEYKQVSSRRTVRAGKRVVREMAGLLEEEVRNQLEPAGVDGMDLEVTFAYADEVTRRMAWCRPQPASSSTSSSSEGEATGMMKIPSPLPDDQRHIHIPFTRFSKPSETVFFPPTSETTDDHDLSLPQLVYRVLLALPPDLRALCTSRVIVTGGQSTLPGLKPRLLHELSTLITTRGWDAVNSYGSASAWHSKVLVERSANIDRQKQATAPDVRFAADKKPIQDGTSHGDRIHDDVQDPITKKVVTEMRKGKAENSVHGAVRGVETLGAWSGASLLASLRVKGVHEVERDEFLKHGLRDDGAVVL